MYDFLLNIEGFISSIPGVITIIAIVLATFGWYYSAHRNRVLQRRGLAISLLHDHRFATEWLQSIDRLREAFEKSKNDKQFWTNLGKKRREDVVSLTEEEQKYVKAATTILNTYEFISVGMLDSTVDEKIVRESRKTMFIVTHDCLADYIEEMRKVTKIGEDGIKTEEINENIYINFKTIVKKWKKKSWFCLLIEYCTKKINQLNKHFNRAKPASKRT